MPAPKSTSLIDRVDAADRPVGVVARKDALAEGANFRVVHIFVFNSSGQLLLQRLGQKRDRHPGLWGSSVAGYLNQGETYLQAAERRLREELKLDVPLIKHGATWMNDEGSRKFIDLYIATADNVQIGEPRHIDAVEFRSLATIEEQLRQTPSEFTDTFRHLFRFYLLTTDADP